jgi:hypothetical protein
MNYLVSVDSQIIEVKDVKKVSERADHFVFFNDKQEILFIVNKTKYSLIRKTN